MTALVAVVDGKQQISALAAAVLIGVELETVAELVERGELFPVEWLQAKRRRRDEVKAATGSDDLVVALEYWALKDLGTHVVIVDGEVLL
jgi:hypothetical protein